MSLMCIRNHLFIHTRTHTKWCVRFWQKKSSELLPKVFFFPPNINVAGVASDRCLGGPLAALISSCRARAARPVIDRWEATPTEAPDAPLS